ncbi:unnamed protein product [Hyaloperonospora brassicae]|uniref:C2 NT-type domain-containing protein n=1 Tax=Hyaloperonospora brassicae TaxID=162125 RepID=A0AAV0TCR2_HYABA|nr:unnamed protein product [Hyaloperonospora brassicae]
MASSAIGACSLSLKHVVTLGAPTLDRWVDLKRGTKYAGRIRLQLRLVDASTSSGQDSNVPDTCRSQDRDTHLSVPGEETLEDIAARSRKSSRRGHKYHRSARRFDGRPLTNTALASSCSTNSSSSSSSRRSSSSRLASDKDNSLKRVSTPRRSLRNHSSSATSSESIDDDSNPASDESASPIVSPRRERSSSEDGSVFCDVDSSFAMDRRAAKGPTLSPLVTPGAMESYTRMRRSELEYSKAKIANVSREPRTVKLPENGQRHLREDDDDDLDECVYRCSSNMSSIDNCTKSSVLSSISDSRESSRMDFDDDDDGWGPVSTTKESLKHRSGSTALSSVASSIFDPRDSSRVSFGDSESGDEESDDVKLEKAHEQRRQQWRMEQQKKQLAAIEERPYSMSDDESDQEGDEHDGLELDSSRMQFTPTIATLLTRESNNVLMDEEDDEEGPESHKLSEEFVPILEASSPMSVDFVDSALRLSSCSS